METWFNLITQRAIRRGTFKSVKELIARIEHFVQQYNTHCRPFVWTATAESILEKIKGLCQYISETRHWKGESKMGIEFPTGPTIGDMTVDVTDNWPTPPAGPSAPCSVNIKWTIPSPHNMNLGGTFQLRAYVESLGPGQEMQLGSTIKVPVIPGQTNYNTTINVPGGNLLGEGQLYNGVPVSGVYKIVAVLQHLNTDPTPTWISGFAEGSIRMFLSP